MRTNSDVFNEKNLEKTKEIRLVIEIDFSSDGTDLHYFTSHSDIPTVSPVIHGVLNNTSSISQKLVPERANSSIGSLSFELLDAKKLVTTLFNTKRVDRKILFGKRVRLYLGYKDLEWSEYRIEQTQYIGKKVQYKEGIYSIGCNDSQGRMNKNILQPLETRLSATISDTATSISVYSVAGWQLVEHDDDFLDAPSSTCTYLEISDGTNKEYCRVTAIGTSFTVVRGVLNTTARAWEVPADATDEKGPKIKELIFFEMNSLKLAYAIMTGVQIGQVGTLPPHWHLGMDAGLFTSSEFVNINNLGFPAYAFDFKKTDGKKFIEEELMLPNSCYLRINGAGNFNLKRIFAINTEASSVETLDKTNIINHGGLNLDASVVTNRFEINWSWDARAKKQEYRRKSTFVFQDSVDEYGEKLKSFKFRLINGVKSSSTTLINIVNSFSDRFAGEAARLNVGVIPSLNDLEVGDVITMQHPNIQDFNVEAGVSTSINRSMQIISTKVDQRKGLVNLELFGSTFTPAPLKDGDLRVINDTYYTAAGTQIPNITTDSLTINTTLTGSVDNTTSIFYHNADLTIPAGVTLSITQNVQLRIKGHLTVLGDINCAGSGRGSGGGFIGTSRGHSGSSCYAKTYQRPYQLCNRTMGRINVGEFEAVPTFDLINDSGDSIGGIPTDLRGSAGARGGPGRWSDGFETFDFSPGGTGNASGAGCLVICRGMSLSGGAAVNMSGVDGNEAVQSGKALGGKGGHSTSGALVILLDGGASSMPNLFGRITAISNNGNDIKLSATRVQFIPQARIASPDETVEEPVTGNITFRQTTSPTNAESIAAYGRSLIQNDLWIDTNDSNKNYLWDGTSWIYNTTYTRWDGIDGLPGELIDGRIAAGFDGFGDLRRNISTSRLDSSNVLRRSGGGLYTGDTAATAGATWGTNITSRPAELTDGRIAAGFDGFGDLKRNISTSRLDSSNVLRKTGGGLYTGATNATLGATWGADVGSIPTNLNNLTGTENIKNTQISMNSNGSLSGAGSGAVTIGGLGYNGDLNANYITNTTELTDGANLGITANWSTVSGVPTSALTRSAIGSMNSGGFGNIRFVKNTVQNGTSNDGEIQTLGNTFYHPDGTKRTIVINPGVINTPFEGSIKKDPFFIIYTDQEVTARFPSANIPGSGYFFLATYDLNNDQWEFRDNANAIINFTPLSSDCIVAIGRKWTSTGGIDSISSLIGVNTNLPTDGATVGATWGANITSRPNELTDGRVSAGLNSSGDLNRNISSTRLNSSNVLRRSGGGLYTGATNATYGAPNGSSVGDYLAEDLSSLQNISTHGGSLIQNSDMSIVAADGRPAGVKAVYGSSNVSNISYQNTAKTILKVRHSSDTSIGAGWPAFRVDSGLSYKISIRVKSSGAASSGFYFRMQELDSELPLGITHICNAASASESGVIEDTRQKTSFKENAAIGTVWTEYTFTYKPTSTAKWVSPIMLNWSGMGANELHVDRLSIYPFVNSVLDIDYSGALNATAGATWGSNVSGRPSELTDGRISAGLNSSGDLNRNISTSRLTSSNVLRRSGGGLYTGATNATNGDPSLRSGTSGIKLGDQRNTPNVLSGGASSALNISTLSAADVGTTATITVAAHSRQYGFGSIPYSSGSISGLLFSRKYYVYTDDPNYAGGTRTFVATTSIQNITANNGRLYLGSITTPANGGGGSTPPPEDCVAEEMYAKDNLQVRDLKVGDDLQAHQVSIGFYPAKVISHSKTESLVPCVRISTASGASVICSTSTPIEQPDGTSLEAQNLMGGHVYAEQEDASWAWEHVIVENVEPKIVIKMNVGDVSFPAGEKPNRRIVTHNAQLKP